MSYLNTITETQVQSIRKALDNIEAQICELLQISESAYCQYKYRVGLDFIARYYPCPRLQYAAERSKVFWNYWKLCWLDRDEAVLQQRLDDLDVWIRNRFYQEAHNVDLLREELLPGQPVMDDLYKILNITKYRDEKAKNQI